MTSYYLLYPVIDFRGPNIVLNFHVDWLRSFRTSLTLCVTGDRQTDGQSLKAPCPLRN